MRIGPILGLALLAAASAGAYSYWVQVEAARVPQGLARANGRIEVERIDVSAKYAGRLADVRVAEGDLVSAGDVVARLDAAEIEAQLASARAALHRSHQSVARAQADVVIREAELRLAETELRRSAELIRSNAATQAEYDRRSAQRDVARAVMEGAKIAVEDAKAATSAATAQISQIEAVLSDLTLKAPRSGRVEYRLAQSGEVVPAGGRVLTLLDLSDAHMSIFLPTAEAGRVELGSEARIVLDSAPEFILPARVAFVAAQAQFTPRYVETRNEREKLMYRVKLHLDPNLLGSAGGYVKAGATGNAYVMVSSGAQWPAALAIRLPEGALSPSARINRKAE